jgi:pimeloyl-ACP methyl ester carboxylesterase
MDIVLVAGLWLRAAVWSDVADELVRLGHRPYAVELPVHAGATLDDQVDAVLAAVDRADRAVVVGHSASATLAWIAADRRPGIVEQVVLIGGFPTVDGGTYADFFPTVDEVMPFPGWDAFSADDVIDLDGATRERLVDLAVPVPAAVASAVVRLGDPRRLDVPVVLVCTEFGPDDARGWIADGAVAELATARHVSFVDIDAGHWPMVTRPVELARLLDSATRPS